MGKQLPKIRVSKYYRSAAMYQPNQEQLRRLIVLVLLLLTVFVIGSLVRAHAAGQAAGTPHQLKADLALPARLGRV